MRYNDQAELDPSQMGGGRGNGGKIAIGGGAGLVVIVLALLFGVNPGDILGTQSTDQQTDGSTSFAQCTRGSDISKDRDCRFVAYTNSIQDYWGGAVKNYQVVIPDFGTVSGPFQVTRTPSSLDALIAPA